MRPRDKGRPASTYRFLTQFTYSPLVMPRKLVPERYVRATSNRPTASTSTVAAWQTASDDATLRALLERPASLLSEYFRERGRSRLGRIVNTANRLAETCETVVLVGPSGSTAAARTLLAASSHPFYDRLSHGGRGGRPRIVCLEPTLDNDLLQAAFDLLKATDDGHAPGDRWVSAVIDPSAATTADERRDFETLLQALPVADVQRRFQLVDHLAAGLAPASILDTADDSQLPALHGALFLDGAALFAAALVGSDTVALCKGGAWFHEDAKQASPAECEAVQLADFLTAGPTQLVAWHHALEPLAKRFAAVVREGEAPAEPHVEVVAGYEPTVWRRLVSDSSSRCVHLFTDVVRRDRLTMPSPLVAAYDELRAVENGADRPWHEIRLARLNDQSLGELCAWFEAVTVMGKSQA